MIDRLLPLKARKRDYTPYDGPKRKPGRARKHIPPAFERPSKTNGHFKSKPLDNAASQSLNTRRPKPKPRRKLSPLETLPVELLQNIFLDSMNVALPRASLQLAMKLSSEHLQLEMSMKVLYLQYYYATKKDRSRLVTCRFFTLDFLLKYVQHGHRYWYKNEATQADRAGLQGAANFVCGDSVSREKISHEQAWAIAQKGVIGRRRFASVMPYLVGLTDLYIPEKLLHGPWSEKSGAFLQILCRRGNGIDWDSSASDVAMKGIFEAIRAGDERASECLIDHDPAVQRVQPTHDMFRCVVLEGDCNQTIITTILGDKSDHGVPLFDPEEKKFNYLDPELWAWIDKRGRSDEKAAWLEKVLKSSGEFIRWPVPEMTGSDAHST